MYIHAPVLQLAEQILFYLFTKLLFVNVILQTKQPNQFFVTNYPKLAGRLPPLYDAEVLEEEERKKPVETAFQFILLCNANNCLVYHFSFGHRSHIS